MTKDYSEMLGIIYDEETREQARIYFEKYWLDKNEYFEEWISVQNSIFNNKAEYLPDMMFNSDFELFPLVGGDIFVSEKDFTLLQECMRQTGDKFFVIVQNRNVAIEGYPFTRFKYPVNISWDELMSGGIMGIEHFNNGCKDYFVFGDSAIWGRYVGNSYVKPGNLVSSNPLNIMGFKKEYSDVFRKNFEEVRRLEPQITPEILFSEWLPDSYQHPYTALLSKQV